MRTMKNIMDDTEAFGGVENKERLMAALPLIVEAQERIKSMAQTMKKLGTAAGKLNESASKYALEHQSVFDDGLYTDAKGVVSGDVSVGDEVYHLAAGYADPKRTDGDAMSQDFLEGLPSEWTQNVLKLWTGGINRSGATAEDLAKKGLYRPAKNVWTSRVSENLNEIG